MITYYFKIAARNLWKNKSFSAITIFGLAIGLATCILITLFVTDELSYDKFHRNYDRIYRINADFLVNGNTFRERHSPALFGEVLQHDYPQIEKYCRITLQGGVLVTRGQETIAEQHACFGDSSLFDVFTLPMLAGDAKTALREPSGLVISEKIAKKYFNSIDVVGKTLRLDNQSDYIVTGVIKDVPAQSHVHFDFIRAMAGVPESRQDQWMADNFTTYVRVRPGTTKAQLDGFLATATERYMDEPLRKMVGSSIADLKAKGEHFGYNAIRIDQIHFTFRPGQRSRAFGQHPVCIHLYRGRHYYPARRLCEFHEPFHRTFRLPRERSRHA
ncbi:ABC transporter permease [Chitinophaga horti]|uniref:ABC transporter permease n=1 Tax=Chitinophaga horti TaxID=2920382 RepID=A0ABY6J884_9BACT|nr:ABC transporter permease [Chitinophaga horti]UYQ95848.1 ABC transporter permease [Chitinophaga horti]